MEQQTQDCVTLTPEAVVEVQRMIAAELEPEGKALRVYVEQGGCSGMQYGLVFDEKRDADSDGNNNNVFLRVLDLLCPSKMAFWGVGRKYCIALGFNYGVKRQ